MKVQGIPVVRSQGSGKVDRAATVAKWIVNYESKFRDNLAEFEKALDHKLAGGKDHEDAIADALVAFFARYAESANTVTVSRSIIVGMVVPELIKAGHFTHDKYKEVTEMVESFIFDNSCTKDAPNPDAWFKITTGRGRGAGMVTEQRRPQPESLEIEPGTEGNLNALVADELPSEEQPSGENTEPNADPLASAPLDQDMVDSLDAAAEALRG